MFFTRLIRRLIKHFGIKLGVLIHEVNHIVAYETLPKFGNASKNVKIDLPRRIVNPHRIFFGNDVCLGPGSLLMAVTHYPGSSIRNPDKKQPAQQFNSRIILGNRVTSTGGLEIAAQSRITIEDDVMFASNIHINDAFHGYENANEPYKYQKISIIAPVLIKRGCWIGQNVVILPGVTIGKYSIIGANSVVTKSVPDRCIAVGSPANVMKRWDENANRWVSVAR